MEMIIEIDQTLKCLLYFKTSILVPSKTFLVNNYGPMAKDEKRQFEIIKKL